MDPKFLKILHCPKTGENLVLESHTTNEVGMVTEGLLRVENHPSITYPIIAGIPRFVEKEQYTSSFGYEWKKWPDIQFESKNIGLPMEGRTRNMFEETTGFTKEKLNNSLVVEFGCGSGRFLDIVRNMGACAVGIDMSQAVEVARENFKNDSRVLIVQGDILNPPFKRNVFEFGYSIGVFHHTPDPALCVKQLAACIRTGGEIAVRVYPKKSFYDYWSVFLFRKCIVSIEKIFGESISRKIAVAYAYISSYYLYYILNALRKIPLIGYKTSRVLEKFLLVNANIPDARWRVLDVFDAITPKIASTHTADEVRNWFKDAHVDTIKQTTSGSAFVGITN